MRENGRQEVSRAQLPLRGQVSPPHSPVVDLVFEQSPDDTNDAGLGRAIEDRHEELRVDCLGDATERDHLVQQPITPAQARPDGGIIVRRLSGHCAAVSRTDSGAELRVPVLLVGGEARETSRSGGRRAPSTLG